MERRLEWYAWSSRAVVLGMTMAVSACAARLPATVTPESARLPAAVMPDAARLPATATSATQGPAGPPPPPATPVTAKAAKAARAGKGAAPAGESLESFMAKVRQLSAEARPERPRIATVESSDAALMTAIAGSLASPSPATYRAAALEYRRLQIVDKAHGYLERALRMDPRDAATHDALARLWRDAGLPHIALGNAYRAVHFSGGSPVTRNTLGTVFQALGRHGEARAEYLLAVAREPAAAYAWSNLCYAWLLEGHAEQATAACDRALGIEPELAAAQNNLGLARALAGDSLGTVRAFALAGDTTRAHFNMGIVQLADGRYAEAVVSFQRAHDGAPSWRDAALRGQQALDAVQDAAQKGRE